MTRVLVDANILISALLSNQPDRAINRSLRMALQPGVQLIVPQELLDEVRAVSAAKPYLRQRLTPERVEEFLAILADVGQIPARLLTSRPLSRDPKDDYLLAYALVEEVDYLLTGDEDLLTIGRLQGVQIVNPVTFLQKMNP